MYQKFRTDYQACAHAFAYADINDRGENYDNRMFFENDTIYSYGYHFIIAKKVRNNKGEVTHVLFSNSKASKTTSKQQYIVRRALYQKILDVYTSIEYFDPLKEIKAKEKAIIEATKKYERARADYMKNGYLTDIQCEIQDIIYLAEYYKCKSKIPARIKDYIKANDTHELLKLLGTAEKRRNRADSIEKTLKEKREIKRRQKQIADEQKAISKWKENKKGTIILNHIDKDFLRVTKDGNYIETSQGIKVTKDEAKRLLKLIDLNKIIGNKVNEQYLITAFNGTLKVGCHNIPREEIESIRKAI